MIRLTNIIENQPYGVTKSTWDHIKADFQNRFGLGEESSTDVSRKGKKCNSCGKGTFQEMSQYDDMDGTVTCSNCRRTVKSRGPWPIKGDKKGAWHENIKREHVMNKTGLQKLVKEEYVKIQKEALEAAPKIAKKLADCREQMVCEFFKRERVGTTFEAVMEKRLQLQTVSEMIDVPVNELVLYFLNHVKTMNERSLVEYRLGHVYFYAQ